MGQVARNTSLFFTFAVEYVIVVLLPKDHLQRFHYPVKASVSDDLAKYARSFTFFRLEDIPASILWARISYHTFQDISGSSDTVRLVPHTIPSR